MAHPIADRPADLERTVVCALSGMRAGDACLSRTSEWLPHDADAAPCSWHHLTDDGPVVFWPAPYREWASAQQAAAPGPRQMRAAHESLSRAAGTLSIVSPGEGAVYLLDPTLRPEFQSVALRASLPPAASLVHWTIDSRAIGPAGADSSLLWPLSPGRHHIQARDDVGNVAETTIVVR